MEVYSVATFYSMRTLEKQGKFVIRVCVSLPCYLKGSREILEAIKKELNIEEYQTTADKKFTIKPVSCLGLCDIAPAIMINKEVYGNLTPQKVRDIIQKYKEAKWTLLGFKDNILEQEWNINRRYPPRSISNGVRVILKNIEKKIIPGYQ